MPEITKYEFLEFLLDSSEFDKVQYLHLIIDSLNVRPIQKAADDVGISYNGWKDHRKTIRIAGKVFAYDS